MTLFPCPVELGQAKGGKEGGGGGGGYARTDAEAHLSNLVGELGLGLPQDAWLRVVVALPGQVAGRAVAQPHKDGCHCTLHLVWAPLQTISNKSANCTMLVTDFQRLLQDGVLQLLR